MKYFNKSIFLLLLLCSSTTVIADIYIGVAPAQIKIDTPNASTSPLMANLNIGYEYKSHLFELALLSSINEDNLNQLTVDIPSAKSILYRYLPYRNDRMRLNLIIGFSQVDIESSYPDTVDTTDTFEGISYGIGFEEALKSIPNLKIKFDWMQLYHGEDLNLNLVSLGIRYVF